MIFRASSPRCGKQHGFALVGLSLSCILTYLLYAPVYLVLTGVPKLRLRHLVALIITVAFYYVATYMILINGNSCLSHFLSR